MARTEIGPFSVDVAEGWALTTVILMGPLNESAVDPPMLSATTQRFQQNIVASREKVDESATPQSYLEAQVEGLRKAGVDRSEVSPPTEEKLDGGLSGLLTEQIVLGPSGDWVRQMQLICIKGGYAYTLIASHLDGDRFEHARKDFKAILLSFK